jgi:hypothetical protein
VLQLTLKVRALLASVTPKSSRRRIASRFWLLEYAALRFYQCDDFGTFSDKLRQLRVFWHNSPKRPVACETATVPYILYRLRVPQSGFAA